MENSDQNADPIQSHEAITPAVVPEAILAARKSVAARLLANQATLLAFIRQRLGHAAAGERGAEDVFATTLRRSDALVSANVVLAELSDDALMALASTISQRAIFESSRLAERARRIRNSAAERSRARDDGAETKIWSRTPELEDVIRSELSEDDLAILVLRLDDQSWVAIAAVIGTTPAGAHRRYYRALKALKVAVGIRCAGDASTRSPPTR